MSKHELPMTAILDYGPLGLIDRLKETQIAAIEGQQEKAPEYIVECILVSELKVHDIVLVFDDDAEFQVTAIERRTWAAGLDVRDSFKVTVSRDP